ncbi:hypothetical protein BKA62DRAFT_196908 [Auriculariales sp. MPI-PUGE-AT-0066]|nr:hypothetical protein BKA62DRAFT_196908 [Auriculariales sp. MPI-PUGE-AT-0066]
MVSTPRLPQPPPARKTPTPQRQRRSIRVHRLWEIVKQRKVLHWSVGLSSQLVPLWRLSDTCLTLMIPNTLSPLMIPNTVSPLQPRRTVSSTARGPSAPRSLIAGSSVRTLGPDECLPARASRTERFAQFPLHCLDAAGRRREHPDDKVAHVTTRVLLKLSDSDQACVHACACACEGLLEFAVLRVLVRRRSDHPARHSTDWLLLAARENCCGCFEGALMTK